MMPTNAGTPLPMQDRAPGYIGQLHPYDWLTLGGDDFKGVQQASIMRGHPTPLAWWQKRPQWGPRPVPQGQPLWLHSRPYDRGAAAYAPKFGVLSYNPIGAGIYSPYKLPVIAGPAARYEFGAIFFDVQSVTTGLRFNSTVPTQTVDALIGHAHVGPSYRTTG
jgi:hypothetical protein